MRSLPFVLLATKTSTDTLSGSKETSHALWRKKVHSIVHKMQSLPDPDGFSPLLRILYPSALFDSNIQMWYFHEYGLVEDEAASCL
jgi:hypothetical protein